ncbi:MAG: Cupin 2, conserved barrel [Micavibrio sp.]|nr:Cupin 2, conserved barrel [Micavibrio sp.]
MDQIFLKPNKEIPNNAVLPVLVYPQVLPADEDCSIGFEKHFRDNNWHGIWRDGVYDYHHFHSQAHEVLGVVQGKCRIQVGGMAGHTLLLEQGDMIVLPAGTGHKDAGSSDDLVVIGAYPPGQAMDICRSKKECPDAERKIAATPIPPTDPFYGHDGPLIRTWIK